MKFSSDSCKAQASRLLSLVCWLVMALVVSSCATPPSRSESDTSMIVQRVGELLARYASNDQEGVISMLDTSGFTLYGSDVAELVRTPAGVRELMTNDFALWQTAKFEAIQDLDVVLQGAVATAYFHVPLSVGGRPPILVRISTTWRRVDGEWLLAQSANTVPTTGSSAAELVKHK
jgi:hypothetical protein